MLSALAAAALVAAGFEAGYHYLLPRLNQALDQAAQATARANRLVADNASLERRLSRLEAALARCSGTRRPEAKDIPLGRFRAFAGGRLVVGVERLWPEAGKALVWMRSAQGLGGRKLLSQGQGVQVKVMGRRWRVVLVKIGKDFARIAVAPAARP